jgi:hypothetical protein
MSFREPPDWRGSSEPSEDESLQTIGPKSEEMMIRPGTDVALANNTYRSQWLTQAWTDFCAKSWQETTVSGITGAIMVLTTIGLFIAGVLPGLSLLPVGIFICVLLSYFAFVLLRAPRKLDEKRCAEIEKLETDIATQTGVLTVANAEIETVRKGLTESESQTERSIDLWTQGKAEVVALRAENQSLKSRLDRLTEHKLIATVMRKFSKVDMKTYEPWDSPRTDRKLNRIYPQIAIKFKNLSPDPVTIEGVRLIVCERHGEHIRDLPLRGRDPEFIYQQVKTLRLYDDPSKHVEIEGLRVEGYGQLPENRPAYFYFDDNLIIDVNDLDLINDKHFLRLILTAVAQKPYVLDIKVDNWTQPQSWIKPVEKDQ